MAKKMTFGLLLVLVGIPSAHGAGIPQTVAADFDVDGDADILIVPADRPPAISLTLAGRSIQSRNLDLPPAGRFAVGDLDLDGDPDLLQIGGGAGGLGLYLNRWTQAGKVDFYSGLRFPESLHPLGVPLLLDWDVDGDLDLAVAGTDPGSWRLLRNEVRPGGGLSLVDVTAESFGSGSFLPGVTEAAVGDIDGDGFPDLLAVGMDGPVLLHNLGTGRWREEAAERGFVAGPAGSVAVADFDLDGRADVLTLGDGTLHLYHSEGARFREIGTGSGLLPLAAPASAVAADLDFDGLPDLLLVSRDPAEPPRLYIAVLGEPGAGISFAPGELPAPLLRTAPGSRPAVSGGFDKPEVLVVVPVPGGVDTYRAAVPDTDCDGLSDPFEGAFGLQPSDAGDRLSDPDGDHLPNQFEYRFGLRPDRGTTHPGIPDETTAARLFDLDNDGVSQAFDRCQSVTDPAQEDRDGDGRGNACDTSPDGGVEIGVTVPVLEFAQISGGEDRRYLSDRDQIEAAAEALRGYFEQGVGFRWFAQAGEGLEPVHEIVAVGNFHRYVRGEELPPDTQAPIVGWVATRGSLAGLRLVPLLHFVQDCGAELLTVDSQRASKLRGRPGWTELAPLGFATAFTGQYRPVPVFELAAPADGTPLLLYTTAPAAEADVAGFLSSGERFRVLGLPTPGTQPLFRLTDRRRGDQVLTLDPTEREHLKRIGYRSEGVLGFVFNSPVPFHPEGTLALQRLRLPTGEHAYAAGRERFEELIAAGAVPEGTAGWVLPPRSGAGRCIPAPGATTAATGARRVVSLLRNIADPQQRAIAAAGVFNGLCSIRRVLDGTSDPEIRTEQILSERLAKADPETRRQLREAGRALEAVTPAERAELLGPLAFYDPLSCEGPPLLFAEIDQRLEATFNARLRTNLCAGLAEPYPAPIDPRIDNAERAITVGADSFLAGATGGRREIGIPSARPFILGFDSVGASRSVYPSLELATDFETRRHPPGEPFMRGDGYYPFGLRTETSCGADVNACPRSEGQICGSLLGSAFQADRCYAFPVIERGKDFYVKGYNFWDPTDALLRLTPAMGGRPLNSVPLVRTSRDLKAVLPGESDLDLDAPAVCQPPQPTVPGVPNSENSAVFALRPDTPPGFYRVAMYNHNGLYLLHRESGGGSLPVMTRTIHVCYRLPPDDRVALPVDAEGKQIPECPPGETGRCVKVDCTPPTGEEHSCASDGGACLEATWETPPRPLSQCRSSIDPAATPRCPETPEWFASEPLRDEAGRRDPIVYVTDAPTFELQAALTRVRCREESGWDLLGEDETSVILLALAENTTQQGLNAGQVEDLGQSWRGDFDTGTETFLDPARLLGRAAKLGLDDHLAFGLLLIERDSKAGIIAVGSVAVIVTVVAVALGTCFFVPPTCPFLLNPPTLISASALGIAILTGIVLASDVDDPLGAAYFGGTPRDFGLRVNVVHRPDFTDNPVYQTDPGPLQKSALPPDDGEVVRALRTPADLPSLTLTGFAETTDIEHDDGDSHYEIELLLRRLRCVAPPEMPSSPEETFCPSSGDQ